MKKVFESAFVLGNQFIQKVSVKRNILLFGLMAGLLVFVGIMQSWNVALSILNMKVINL